MPVGELKRRFSEVIDAVRNGESIVVSYGKTKKEIAVIVPFSEYWQDNSVRLGLLENEARCEFADDFEMTAEELLGV